MKIAAVSLVATTGVALSAVPPLSPEDLEEQATHVVIGEVVEVESKVKGITVRNRHYEITVEVESVAKGDDLKAGARIVVRAWQPAAGLGPRPPGLQGHSDVPGKGDRIKVFLRKSGDGYEVLHPNGFGSAPPKP